MNERQWFEKWFDTPYYHLLYNHRDDKEAAKFIEQLLGFLDLPKGSRILDIGCGKGRHSRYFASAGYKTTGIDLSPMSIAEARKDAEPGLNFEIWDMRIPFRENGFDLVVNLFSSFGYFESGEDDQKALNAMAANLKEDGILVLDYMNPEYIVKIIKTRDIIDRGEVQFHIRKKIENGFILKEIDFLADHENHHFEERLKLIKPGQFEQLLQKAGIGIIKVFGNYDLCIFDAAHSPRQVIIGKKLPSANV